MITIFSLFDSLTPVFLFLFIGIVLRHYKQITPESDKTLLKLVFNLFFPCLIFSNIASNPAVSSEGNLIFAPLIGFVNTLLGFGVGYLVGALLFPKDVVRKRTFAFVIGVFNYGFIPLAIMPTLFPDTPDTSGLIFIHNLGVEIALWSVGILLLTGSSSIKDLRQMINAPLLAILFSLIVNLSGFGDYTPTFFKTTTSVLGGVSIPLGIMLAGTAIYDSAKSANWASMTKVAIVAPMLRNGIIPLLMLSVGFFLPISANLERVVAVQAAMPAAMFSLVITRNYNGDIPTATILFLASNIIGMITMPYWIQFGLYLFS